MVSISFQVHILKLDNLGLFNQLPSNIYNRHDRQFDVIADKGYRIEAWAKRAPALVKNQDNIEDDACPRATWIGPVLEEYEALFTLSTYRASETNRSDINCYQKTLIRNADNVL